jgi:hypothetical protein
MQKTNEFDPVSVVQIPANIPTNTPLKLRISSDEVGSNNGPYDNVNRGQVEDYSIIVSNCEGPGNVQITQINNTSIELSWVPGGNESSWNIKYNPIILGAQVLLGKKNLNLKNGQLRIIKNLWLSLWMIMQINLLPILTSK